MGPEVSGITGIPHVAAKLVVDRQNWALPGRHGAFGDVWRSRVKHLNQKWVTRWTAAYPLGPDEVHLLNVVGPSAQKRGHFTLDELVKVARWKSARAAGRVGSNSPRDVKVLTGAALSAPAGYQHLILTLLNGVQVRMASAILTIVYPRRETVMDVRALGAIERLTTRGEITHRLSAYGRPHLPPYMEYRDLCAATAKTIGCPLRDLDRALWTWHAAGMPPPP